ncbi:hypothetical protein FA95DRAFT_1564366 [Auriscalpium vulgare]|uniref:Uncharacterized protein n=1 Tax=Auriscalpium vulgare TaxID=40419 RepID=A0ACB8RDX5_9AGAM|nr:hypothetical protein FA95DRAFT_1564366 [Auriscalpium vulgare]
MSRASRSSLPPLTGTASVFAARPASRSPTRSQSTAASGARARSHTLSGSETEREGQAVSAGGSYTYSSDDQSVTPPSSVAQTFASSSVRLRRVSLPESPSKAKDSGSQRTPRKRVSMAMSVQDADYSRRGDETEDITTAALAAVASLRRSPTSSGKKSRQPLPREFREPRKANSDGRSSRSGEPTTPQKARERHTSLLSGSGSPSPRASTSRLYNTSQLEMSPRRNGSVRDATRRHQTRWMSEDLSSVSEPVHDHDEELEHASGGRRQAARTGSMESSLGARLVGDSLRAAGITMRRDGPADVFAGDGSVRASRRPRSSGTASVGQPEWEETASIPRAGPSRLSNPSRQGERSGVLYDPRTPATASSSHYRAERGAVSGPLARPSTSMADFHNAEHMPPPRTVPSNLRTYKSTYALDRDREGIGSSSSRLQLYPQLQAPAFQERTYGSPRARPRNSLPNSTQKISSADEQATEHLHLMDDSLTNFETLLSRLPSMGETTTVTVPELYRNAQSIVRYSEQVNGLLRDGTNHALAKLIDAELDDGEVIDRMALWKDIGSDFRDCLRVSDELVRTMTGFLLGAGRVLRESSAYKTGSNGNGTTNLQHLRGTSDDMARRSALDNRSSTSGTGTGSGKGSASGDGRRSADSRRSLDAARTERDKADLLNRVSSRADGILAARASSSLLRDREAPLRERVGVKSDDELSPPPAETSALRSNGIKTLSTRRLHALRDHEPSTPHGLATVESQESLHEWEPSPTPAPRQSAANAERQRMLPPLAIPPPLPSLPSESIVNGRGSLDKSGSSRRKISTNSTVTVRAVNPNLNIAPPSATTALTPHTVSNSSSKHNTPDRADFPLTRTSSASTSDSSSKKNNVTFSRPLTVSVTTLSGLQQRDSRSRTTSTATNSEEPPPQSAVSSASPSVWTPRSGSETERPPRATIGRRTLGAKARVSLEAAREEEARVVNSASGSSHVQTAILPNRKERRRTITEIFS